jgi:hypothetical protein
MAFSDADITNQELSVRQQVRSGLVQLRRNLIELCVLGHPLPLRFLLNYGKQKLYITKKNSQFCTPSKKGQSFVLMKTLIDSRNLPKHIAVIMDGNGRWAKSRVQGGYLGIKMPLRLCARQQKPVRSWEFSI